MFDEIKIQAYDAVSELLTVAKLNPGDIFVVGCSSSEVIGEKIGTHSSEDVAKAIFAGISTALDNTGIFLAAQCCEHLNRAIIIEAACAKQYGLEPVNVVPQPKAGGSFATTAYHSFESPVAVERVVARAGIDIGGTLIGMHLAAVAVPVRLSTGKIGSANIICARTRPKFIGGARAGYNEKLL